MNNKKFSPLRLIYTDYRRYMATGAPTPFHVIFLTQGFWASSTYRLAHWVKKDFKIPILRLFLRIYFVIFQKMIEIITGIVIPTDCEIGSGLYIGHFGPIIINGDTKIGKNCNIMQCVTIGVKQTGKNKGAPKIGDRVYIGPNSVILGSISIENGVVIGAGSVVVNSVSENCIVVGNPAKEISNNGSFELIEFDDVI